MKLAVCYAVIIFQACALWYSEQRHERELKMAGGNYILAAIWGGRRHLFCCREADAARVVPELQSYRVELATHDEAVEFVKDQGTDGRWVAIPD